MNRTNALRREDMKLSPRTAARRTRLPRVVAGVALGIVLLVTGVSAHHWFVRRQAVARFREEAENAHARGDDEAVRAALAGLRAVDLGAAVPVALACGFDGDSETARAAGNILIAATAFSAPRRVLLAETAEVHPNERARVWIVLACGSLAAKSDAALERLHDALDDPSLTVVLTAIAQIRAAAPPRSLPVLRARFARSTTRDRVYWNLEGAIRQLR